MRRFASMARPNQQDVGLRRLLRKVLPVAIDPKTARDRMVERQVEARGIHDPRLLAAMREVPREAFVPDSLRELAYDDNSLAIGDGQTISQPYIVAVMIAAAAIGPGDKVLEVGAGSGYAAAIMGRLAARVFAIERHPTLAADSEERLRRLGHDNVTILTGDGSGGVPDEAPFDAIVVSARGPTVPEPLKRQLKPGGRLVIPVGDEEGQSLRLIVRAGDDRWEDRELLPVRFVPLVGRHGLAEDGAPPVHRPLA
jgi:protein-L-isoaspartate(D-aspartate) O-methyltransferase